MKALKKTFNRPHPNPILTLGLLLALSLLITPRSFSQSSTFASLSTQIMARGTQEKVEKVTVYKIWAWKAEKSSITPKAYKKFEKVLIEGLKKKKINNFIFEGKPDVRPLPQGKETTLKLPSEYQLLLKALKDKKNSIEITLKPPKKEKGKTAKLSRKKPSVILTPIQRKSKDKTKTEQLVVLIDYSKVKK